MAPKEDHRKVVVGELSRARFFQEHADRTQSKVRQWFVNALETTDGLGSAAKALLAEHQAVGSTDSDPVDTDTVIDGVARLILRSSGVVSPLEIDLPVAADHLRGTNWELIGSGDDREDNEKRPAVPPVLTNTRLHAALDLYPGGLEFYGRYSPAAFRTTLAETYEDLREACGHPKLRPFLDGTPVKVKRAQDRPSFEMAPTDVHVDVVDAANHVLHNLGAYGSVILKVVDAFYTQAERAEDDEFVAAAGINKVVDGPLVIPGLGTYKSGIREMLLRWTKLASSGTSPRPSLDGQVKDLRWALCATSYLYRSNDHNVHNDLVAWTVWNELVNVIGRPVDGTGADRDMNRRRLTPLFGKAPARDAIAAHPRLRSACGERAPKAVTAEPAPVAADPTIVTVADCHDYVFDFAAGNGGVVPARKLVAPATVQAIETVTGITYDEFIDRLTSAYPELSGRSRSNNEVRLDELVLEAFPASAGYVREWSEWTLPFRFDGHLVVDGTVVFFEADGEGHFGPSHPNWDWRLARVRDARKAEELRNIYEPGQFVLVCMHHRCLTGNKDQRLTADLVRQVVATAKANGIWWVNIRPDDVDDERSAPAEPANVAGDWGPWTVQGITDRSPATAAA